MKNGGCWIFLSHSSADIEKVRQIRNEFERYGHNPLAFHLRCLSDTTEEGKRELNDLIIREIDSREWFVFCESPEAQASEYVKMEKEHILNTGKSNIWSVDMTRPVEEILKVVKDICTRIKVFISHSHKDHDLAKKIADKLIEKDYDVWLDNKTPSGDNPKDSENAASRKIANYGFVLALITDNYMDSPSCAKEVAMAIERLAVVIPVIIGNSSTPWYLSRYQCYRVGPKPTSIDVDSIVELISANLQCHIDGPISKARAEERLERAKRSMLEHVDNGNA